MQSLGRRVTTTDREGVNGLPYRTDADPRVPIARGTGSLATTDQGIDIYLQRKYTSRSSNTPLAQGIEARLIQAEAALRANDVPGFLTNLNLARASGQPALTDPGTAQGRENLLFRERAYALWLTAHRLGDLRRLVRQYNRNPETVFPTGTYFRAGNGNYGPDVNFPIPVSEDNIPGFTGCIDRNA